ncbi:tRNA modification GTPase GTPBP3, mitochondrial [Centruroides vittatus]|uniref:tRNA modification GTPase GTPBP3, mitochondrial n=1 Tax=Centruroides vittatus TaxID=120091 RepID=UPI0035102063
MLNTVRHFFRRCSSNASISGKTIYALSSGQGRCAIAVIRVSGPSAYKVMTDMARLKSLPEPRKLILRKLTDPETRELLDIGLVSWFPGPNSFSGEDMCEIHVHGGIAVITSVQRSLSKLSGFRIAEPGEFTKRAFFNGKFDLTQVEGLSDLLQAETEMQRHQALLQLDGILYKKYDIWKQKLKKCMANVEAFIDFGEDENIESDVLDNANIELKKLRKEIESALLDNRKGERIRGGVHVVIVGKPNVGKSSLLNIICQREAAIVSPVPGTTRDVISCSLNIGGYPVHISDTAGIRETEDLIENEGVKRAKKCALHSDLMIIMIEANEAIQLVKDGKRSIDVVAQLLNDIGMSSNEFRNSQTNKKQPMTFIAINKHDLLSYNEIEKLEQFIRDLAQLKFQLCIISCKTETGLEDFLKLLQEKIEILCGNPLVENPMLTRERHRMHLANCVNNLDSYFDTINKDIVIAAHHLRKGLLQLGKINGKVTTEDILDVIFKDFCIGK